MEAILNLPIVKSRSFNRKNPVMAGLILLYMFATFYIFLPGVYGLERTDRNPILIVIAFLIYFAALFFFGGEAWLKPKTLGSLFSFSDGLEIEKSGQKLKIPFDQIKKIEFSYSGSRNILTYPHGNKNFFYITTKDSPAEQSVEFVIPSQKAKNKLMEIIKKLQADGVNIEVHSKFWYFFER